MTYWTELVDAAVLGTRRATLPQPGPALPAPMPAPDDPDGIGLLAQAAVASRARRAGYVATEAGDRPAPAPAPVDDRPAVSLAARQRLAELLAAGRPELVIEWVRLLGRAGRRPPEALLPALLTSASGNEQLRHALAGVLGPAAGWLAAAIANPAWAWARPGDQAGAAELAAWTTGSSRERRELLEQARRADPASGRELVAATWSSDGARDRAAFVSALATGLNADDEPLLNQAAADRSFEVRRVATELLARLPGTAVAQRAISRAAAAVRVDSGAITVTPPTELTQEMAADGLQSGARGGAGHRGWMLTQIVAAPPVAWWAEHTGLLPSRVLALGERTDWADALRNGWTMAALRDRDAGWIFALLDQSWTQYGPDTAQLMKALESADLARWLAGRPGDVLFQAFELVPGPWPGDLSAAVRDYVGRHLRADPDIGRAGHITQLRRLLRIAAARLEPPTLPPMDQAEVHPRLLDAWAELMNTLSVRAAMRRELEQEPTP